MGRAATNAIPATCKAGVQPPDDNAVRALSKYMLSIARHTMRSDSLLNFTSWRALLTHMGYTPEEVDARLLSEHNNGNEYMYPRLLDGINDESNMAINDKALRHLLLYLHGVWF